MLRGLAYFQNPAHITAAQRINIIFPRQRELGTAKNHLQGNAGKFWEIKGFLIKNFAMPRKGRPREDPKWAFWDDLPWRMRMANVDMLGTGEANMMGVSGPDALTVSVSCGE